MTGLLLLFMMFYAACGLVLSFVAHVASFTTFQIGENALALFWGVFPAFLSVILIDRTERKKKKGSASREEIDDWELVLAGCPLLLRYMFWACFAYTFVLGIAIFVLDELNLAWRAASTCGAFALCMVFYAMGLAVFTAAYLRRRASPI